MVTKSLLSSIDDIGAVYFDNTKVLRGINSDKINDVMQLIESGLIDELCRKGLFPATAISKASIAEYEMVLEHDRIQNASYPYEWSPEMLRRAGLALLEANQIANKYGYEIKDAHVFNIVYNHNQPMFVDFGSFVKKQNHLFWIAYERFITSYILPLRLYKLGCTSLYKNLFHVHGRGVPMAEFYVIKHPLLRSIKFKTLEKLLHYWSVFKNLQGINALLEKRTPSRLQMLGLRTAFLLRRILTRKVTFNSLKKSLSSIDFNQQTTWGTYHQRVGLYDSQGEIALSKRMQRILEITQTLDIKSVTELAGNQGVLSRQLAKLPGIDSVVCTDYDESAIDKLTQNLTSEERVTPVLLDFMRAPISGRGLPPSERLASDLVIALAVTHHLILGQSYSLASIFSNIKQYAKKFVLIEFMPLGLYSPRNNSYPPVPAWYTEQWFVTSLQHHGEIILREELELNRVLFLISVSE